MRREGDNMTRVKRGNRGAVLRALHESGGMSRKRLAERVALTPAAITKIAGELISEGLVSEGGVMSGRGAGRREIMLALDREKKAALGIFIDLGEAVLSALRLDGSVIFSERAQMPAERGADETVKALCARLLELSDAHALSREDLIGVGVAVRGLVSADGRRVRDSYGALGELDYPICERVEELTGLRAVLSNNVRALFAAQLFLCPDEGCDSQFFLRCNRGIGASLSIDGRIWLGSSQQCAEIGHSPLVRRGGKPCTCGKCGCLETVASPGAIRADAMELIKLGKAPILYRVYAARGELTLEDVLDAARGGDADASALVDRAVEALASALKTVLYTLDPGRIVFYGRIFENGYYLSKLQAELREGVDSAHSIPAEKSGMNLRLEERAAALLAVERLFENGGWDD